MYVATCLRSLYSPELFKILVPFRISSSTPIHPAIYSSTHNPILYLFIYKSNYSWQPSAFTTTGSKDLIVNSLVHRTKTNVEISVAYYHAVCWPLKVNEITTTWVFTVSSFNVWVIQLRKFLISRRNIKANWECCNLIFFLTVHHSVDLFQLPT